MHVLGLWRSPIKSLGGEPLDVAELSADGVAGDRRVHVRGDGGPLTGRSRPGLLTIPASTGPGGVPHVGGMPAPAPQPAHRRRGRRRGAPLAGLRARDRRRAIGLDSLRQRCVVTTIDPDSGAQDVDVLRRIQRDFDGRVALDSWVIRPGTSRIGDPVGLVDSTAEPEAIGGWIVGAPYGAVA